MTFTEKDLKYIWHPYTHQKNMAAPIMIDTGKGALLIDAKGNEYIDAISSWWVTIHGHAHPYIAKKIYSQAKKLEQVIFAGFTHKPAVRLAENLLPLLPGNFEKIFYSDNGSTATEVAIKMALQFAANTGRSKKLVLAFKDAYHGDTFGAMSTSSRGIFTKAFNDKLFDVIFLDKPTLANIGNIKLEIENIINDIACFIYEPLLQGAGGMKMYDGNALDQLLVHLKHAGVICIADEVMTGFHRTGKLFASESIPTTPDIICLSKGLTGGTLPLGITACTLEIYNAFVNDDKAKTFYHGHSFTANPIACTAALSSLRLLRRKKCKKKIEQIIRRNKKFADKLRRLNFEKPIKNIRELGTIVAFELVTSSEDSYLNDLPATFTPFCMEQGVYLRPMGNTIYIMPPYCITKTELKKVYTVIEKFLKALPIPT
ncbi:MAG: adenosylmethionine--8-amino-7-oxononanoate transaminase [Ginsengibacter sp.]